MVGDKSKRGKKGKSRARPGRGTGGGRGGGREKGREEGGTKRGGARQGKRRANFKYTLAWGKHIGAY